MAKSSQIGGIITVLLAAATVGITVAIVVNRKKVPAPDPAPTPIPAPTPTPTPIPGETVDEAFTRIQNLLASTQTRAELVTLWAGGNIWTPGTSTTGAYNYWIQLVQLYQSLYQQLPDATPAPAPTYNARVLLWNGYSWWVAENDVAKARAVGMIDHEPDRGTGVTWALSFWVPGRTNANWPYLISPGTYGYVTFVDATGIYGNIPFALTTGFDHRINPIVYAPFVTAPDGTRYYQQVQSGEALDAWYAWVEAMGL